MKNQYEKFEFDSWAGLAHEDPQAFEVARRKIIGSMIEMAPDHVKPRLEGLQWKIDKVRETSKNPVASCMRISSLMWDKVLGDHGLLESLEHLSGKREWPSERPNAKVLPFRRPETDE